MALAKLLKLHKRTDFWQIMRMYNRIMRPYYYNQKDKEAEQCFARLLSLSNILRDYGCDTYL